MNANGVSLIVILGSITAFAVGVACSGGGNANVGDSGIGDEGGGSSSGSSGGSSSGASSGSNSGGSSSGTSSGSSSGGSSSGSSGSSSGASSSSSSGGSSGGSSGPLLYTGSISATASESGDAGVYVLTGDFVAIPDGGAAACPQMSGSCCFYPPSDAGAPPAPTYFPAGDITVDDGKSTLSTMKPAANETYSDKSATNAMLVWKPGDTLTVSAAGGQVHTFTGTVKAADEITALNPPLPLTISTGAPFTVDWNPGSVAGATMHLTIVAKDGMTNEGILRCSTKDSDGTLTINKTLLANFGMNDTGSVSLTRQAAASAKCDDSHVALYANIATSGSVKFTP
jgi:hypothetical protein